MKKNYITPNTQYMLMDMESVMQVASLTGQNLVETDNTQTVGANKLEAREMEYPAAYNVWDD
ncbi:MAG: hypothetical protein J5971_04240 [Prevotella sp.]|nr:hypothetical protein [Prevotella sp.]